MGERQFVERFFSQNLNYMRMENLTEEEQKKVRWAKEQGYATFKTLPMGVEAVTEEDLRNSLMWWEKING